MAKEKFTTGYSTGSFVIHGHYGLSSAAAIVIVITSPIIVLLVTIVGSVNILPVEVKPVIIPAPIRASIRIPVIIPAIGVSGNDKP